MKSVCISTITVFYLLRSTKVKSFALKIHIAFHYILRYNGRCLLQKKSSFCSGVVIAKAWSYMFRPRGAMDSTWASEAQNVGSTPAEGIIVKRLNSSHVAIMFKRFFCVEFLLLTTYYSTFSPDRPSFKLHYLQIALFKNDLLDLINKAILLHEKRTTNEYSFKR